MGGLPSAPSGQSVAPTTPAAPSQHKKSRMERLIEGIDWEQHNANMARTREALERKAARDEKRLGKRDPNKLYIKTKTGTILLEGIDRTELRQLP